MGCGCKKNTRTTTLRPFFPNEAAVNSRCKPTFNWFHFGSRQIDLKTNLFFVAVPPLTRFLDVKTHTTKSVKDTSTPTKKMSAGEYPRFLILSDPHNKKVMCEKMGECGVGCSSSRGRLSAECKIVVDPVHQRRLFTFATRHGFDGVVTHHVSSVCANGVKVAKFPVSQECTFVCKSSKIATVSGDECRILRFAKLHNTRIRRTYKSFPTNTQINALQKRDGCTKATKVLYTHLIAYARQ